MSWCGLAWSGRKSVVMLVVSVMLLILAQRSSGRQQAPDEAAAAAGGRKQFEQSCGFCHGADATGARGPDLVRSTLVAHDVKGNESGRVIREGRPDKGMPAMPLSDAQ